ncbi:hypothetical protein HOK68_01500 [Candidatus Woesearchaeota archaeon]|jgi:hypothetical protein|nr:hypothetical protein [Candidatus Woesearchaeota archaeon]MBT4387243.1 hypothetical protein [Candidatus Woesearchaeota archaeon]MBT4596244.1 hypothetical protein [Candidatus Woesearchaeota archaeon]MBT5741533.1 hypothetical protein [Candidatus Woesearchaeota archaeon]MBT6505436.1 hypothetical protein [Candidatus Woesearchaeota archaeon]
MNKIFTLLVLFTLINGVNAYNSPWSFSYEEAEGDYFDNFGNQKYQYRQNEQYGYGIVNSNYDYSDDYIDYSKQYNQGYGRYQDYYNRNINRFLPQTICLDFCNKPKYEKTTYNKDLTREQLNQETIFGSNNDLSFNKLGFYTRQRKTVSSGLGYNSRPIIQNKFEIYNIKKNNGYINSFYLK